MTRCLLSLTLLATFLAAPLSAAEPAEKFFFRKGDRIVFLGDSITQQYQYSTYMELYLTTRFPTWGLSFLNAGIGGDTATGGARRFKADILDEKPTAVTIDFGMNDGGYGKFNPGSAANYAKQTEVMLEMAEKAGVRIGLMSPNAVEVRSASRLKTYLETQKEFYAPLKDLAVKHKVPFVDQYAITRKVLEKLDADMAKLKPFPDGVHTNEAGGLLMAHTILVGLHAPAVVSNVEIDAKGKKASATRAKVSDLSVEDGKVSFKRTDDAIPLPVMKQWRPLLPYVNDLKDLNYYGLKVNGLGAGTYALTIDGVATGSYTDAQLLAGVNLGNLDSGPLHAQGMRAMKVINFKNGLVSERFFGVARGKLPAEQKAEELKRQKELIDALQAAVYLAVKPVPHTFVLTAVK